MMTTSQILNSFNTSIDIYKQYTLDELQKKLEEAYKNAMIKDKFMIIDVETSGLPIRKSFYSTPDPSMIDLYKNARIVEIAYIIYDSQFNIIRKVESLVKPEGFIIENSHIHKITQEEACQNGQNIETILQNLEKDLIDVERIVAHNIDFDINIILSECYRSKKNNLIKNIFLKQKYCTMKNGKSLMKTKKYPKLTELYQYIFKKEVIQKHRALSDVEICADCYRKLI